MKDLSDLRRELFTRKRLNNCHQQFFWKANNYLKRKKVLQNYQNAQSNKKSAKKKRTVVS